MKIITNPIEIYKNVEIGCTINVNVMWNEKNQCYLKKYRKNKITSGVVTSIVNCNICNDDNICSNIKIGIDGKKPCCFIYGSNNSFVGITSIVIGEFFTEEEFSIC